jgi:hypothetical protein
MTKVLMALSASTVLAVTAALAQPAGAPSGGPPSGTAHHAPSDSLGPGEGGSGMGHGMGHGMGMHRHPMPPGKRTGMGFSKGAQFRLHQGNRSIFIKCADDDSTKACVDAISPFLNKLLEMK